MQTLNKKLNDNVHSDTLCLAFTLIPRNLHYVVIKVLDEDQIFSRRMKNLKETIHRSIFDDFCKFSKAAWKKV